MVIQIVKCKLLGAMIILVFESSIIWIKRFRMEIQQNCLNELLQTKCILFAEYESAFVY